MPTLVVGMWWFSRVFHMPTTSVGMAPVLKSFRNRNYVALRANNVQLAPFAIFLSWTYHV
jgi:hypothetical protein